MRASAKGLPISDFPGWPRETCTTAKSEALGRTNRPVPSGFAFAPLLCGLGVCFTIQASSGGRRGLGAVALVCVFFEDPPRMAGD